MKLGVHAPLRRMLGTSHRPIEGESRCRAGAVKRRAKAAGDAARVVGSDDGGGRRRCERRRAMGRYGVTFRAALQRGRVPTTTVGSRGVDHRPCEMRDREPQDSAVPTSARRACPRASDAESAATRLSRENGLVAGQELAQAMTETRNVSAEFRRRPSHRRGNNQGSPRTRMCRCRGPLGSRCSP